MGFFLACFFCIGKPCCTSSGKKSDVHVHVFGLLAFDDTVEVKAVVEAIAHERQEVACRVRMRECREFPY